MKNFTKITMASFMLCVPTLASAALVVDWEYSTAVANSSKRTEDVNADTGDSWSFSESTPLINATEGQNAKLYGGLVTSWSPPAAYSPAVLNLSHLFSPFYDTLRVQIYPPSADTNTWFKGMFVWKKADFLNGGAGQPLEFASGDAISISFANINASYPNREFRFVVKQGGTYYVNSANYTTLGAGLFSITPNTQNQWAAISTDGNYTIGAYNGKSFTDIEAVGFYFYIGKSGIADQSWCGMDITDFQVNASEYVPPVPFTNAMVIDFGRPAVDENPSIVSSRPADSQTTTGDVWNFSDTSPFISSSIGTNAVIYGGVNTSWSPATDYNPYVNFTHEIIKVHVWPDTTSASALEGMLVWKKSEFLNEGNNPQFRLGFLPGDSMYVVENGVVHDGGVAGLSVRFVVQQGNTYYVSGQTFGKTNIAPYWPMQIDPSTSQWAVITPGGSYDFNTNLLATVTFTNIQAVGLYIENTIGLDGRAGVYIPEFQVKASVVGILTEVPVDSTVGIVDFSNGRIVTTVNARAADIDSVTGDTWNFSSTTPLIDASSQEGGMTNRNLRIYGGLKTTWNTGAAHAPNNRIVNFNNFYQIQVNSDGNSGGGTATDGYQGILLWNQAHFLNGGASTTMVFNASSLMTASSVVNSGPIRFVVNDAGTYYVSQASFSSTGSNYLANPGAANWAVISTDNNYTIGSYGPHTFTDIEGVGLYITASATGSQVLVNLSDFQVIAGYGAPSMPVPGNPVGLATVGANVSFSITNNGGVYVVQVNNNLANPAGWTSVRTNSAPFTFTDTNALNFDSQRFYRTLAQ